MNHPFKGDVFALNMFTPLRRFYIMAEDKTFKSKFLSFFLKIYAIYPINKDNPLEAVERSADVVRRGDILAVPSEGCISRNGEVGPFRTGTIRIAMAAGGEVPIVPMFIEKRKNRLHRQRIAIGKPVFLKDLVPPGADITNLTSTQVYGATVMLRDIVCELNDKNVKQYKEHKK